MTLHGNNFFALLALVFIGPTPRVVLVRLKLGNENASLLKRYKLVSTGLDMYTYKDHKLGKVKIRSSLALVAQVSLDPTSKVILVRLKAKLEISCFYTTV